MSKDPQRKLGPFSPQLAAKLIASQSGASNPMKRSVRTNGQRIAERRIESGWTQEQLAVKSGVAKNTILSAEHGGPVAIKIVSILADVWKVPVKELLARDDNAIETVGGEVGYCLDKLAGNWTGRIEQPAGPDRQHFSAEIRFEIARSGAGACGRSYFTFDGITHVSNIEVEWLFERYFKVDGATTDPRGYMFNTCYFQINPVGDRIDGRYIGFGPHSNCIIVGEVTAGKEG